MRNRRLRNRIAASALFAVAALTMATTVGTGTASAGLPPSPTYGTSPHWFVGKPEQIRDAGSDTTFFLIQHLSDLFVQAGLYGCELDSATTPNYKQCKTQTGHADVIATTDVNDNYDHVEIMTGLGKIGSGDGQKQLCGTESAPFGEPDFARSSKPVDTTLSCAAHLHGLGFAKDGVPSVDFPGAEGPGTATGSSTPWAGQVVGPVAAGWLPGDPVTCDTGTAGLHNSRNHDNSCSGVPLDDMSNVGGTGSEAYRLWCATGGTRITDWAQLTHLTGTLQPGQGATISGHPLPILIAAVNSGSGTTATYGGYVGCSLPSTNATTGTTICDGAQVLENNQSQFADCAVTDFPGSDATQAADQAAQIASVLNYESNGVFNSNIHSRIVTLSNGKTYAAVKMTQNGVVPTTSPTGTLMANTFPTARTLYNIYRDDTVRASAADFMNWICDSNNAYTKNVDNNTGTNYNNEITASVQTTYGFIRLNSQTASPNNSCQLVTSVADPSS